MLCYAYGPALCGYLGSQQGLVGAGAQGIYQGQYTKHCLVADCFHSQHIMRQAGFAYKQPNSVT